MPSDLGFKQLPHSVSVNVLGARNSESDAIGASGTGASAAGPSGGLNNSIGGSAAAGMSNSSMTRKQGMTIGVSSKTATIPPPTTTPPQPHTPAITMPTAIFDHKICGFIFNFSNMMPGMLYRSRIDAGLHTDVNRQGSEEGEKLEAGTDGEANLDKTTDSDSEHSGDESELDIDDLDLRQRMALTLRNWCSDDRNLACVAKEGALHALCMLASRDDRITRRYCAAAFDFLSQSPKIRQELVRVGASSVIAQMAVCTKSIRVAASCASCLCNLTLLAGTETRLAEEGVIVAICALLTFPSKDIWVWSVQALYNLTCISDNYNGIDRILKGLLSCYETPYQDLDPSQVVAQALCNLSVVYRMRLRILDEGAMDVINTAIMPYADNEMRYHVAVTLHNISCARTCRPELVNKGALVPLLLLSTQDEPRILDCIAATVQRLSLDPSSRRKTIHDGALKVILNVLARTAKVSATRSCAEALHSFSSYDDCAHSLIKGGAIQALIILSKMEDIRTRQSSAATFCNLLSVEANHASILEEGCMPCLLFMARKAADPLLIDHLSCVLNNLSCGPRKSLVAQQGIVPAIVYIAQASTVTAVKARCAAALANLACVQVNIPQMVSDGVVGCLAQLLYSKEAGLLQHACIALALVAQEESVKEEIVNQGVVEQLLKAIEVMTEERTKQAYCALLGSLSFSPRSLSRLVQAGVVEAIFKLARTEDVGTRKRCATALCNLSFEPGVRRKMVEMNVVATLSHLSNTYSDDTQMDCASCFCNLSCNKENQELMVKQGALTALLMIALVRAVSTRTKEVCARALLNLLTDNTIFKALQEGIAEALAMLSGLESEDCLFICAQAFRVISFHPKGRAKIVGKRTVMQGLFSLVRSTRMETRKVAGGAVHNLLLAPETQVAATMAGGLAVLKVVATLRDPKSSIQCAQAVTKISYLNVCRDYILKESIPSALVLLAQENHVGVVVAALQALTCLSSIKAMRPTLLEAGVVNVVTYHIFSAHFMQHIKEECTRILNYFSNSKDLRPALVKAQVICAAVVLCRRSRGETERESMLASTIENFSWSFSSQERIIEDGGVHLLIDLLYDTLNAPANVRDIKVAWSACATFANLARVEAFRSHLIEAGVIEAVSTVIEKHVLERDRKDALWRMVLGLQHMSESTHLHPAMAARGAIRALIIVAGLGNEVAKQYCAGALCNFTKTKEIRNVLVELGTIDALIKLASTDNSVTQKSCSVALANLSAHAKLKDGAVATLVRLFKSQDSKEKDKEGHKAKGAREEIVSIMLPVQPSNLSPGGHAQPSNAPIAVTVINHGAGAVAAGGGSSVRKSSVAKLRRSFIATSFTHELMRLKNGLRSIKYTPKDLDDADKLDEEEAEGRVFHQKQSGSLQIANTLGELSMTENKTGTLAAMDVAPPPPQSCFYKCKRSNAEEEEGIAVMAAHEEIIRVPHSKLLAAPALRQRFEEKAEAEDGEEDDVDTATMQDRFDSTSQEVNGELSSPRAFAGSSSSSDGHLEGSSQSSSLNSHRSPHHRSNGHHGSHHGASGAHHGDISISEICGPMATGRPSNMRKGISFANNFNAADQEHYEDDGAVVNAVKGSALDRLERNLRRYKSKLPRSRMGRYSYQYMEAKRAEAAAKREQKSAPSSSVDMKLLAQAFHYGRTYAKRLKRTNGQGKHSYIRDETLTL